jgi:2-methylcitrate dehydratase PrpD
MTIVADIKRSEPAPIAEGLSLQLCENLAAWRYEDLPGAVVDTVKRLLLDALGVIGGAARAPGIAELNRRLSRWEATGSATGLVDRHRYSPPTAALANGAAAHALDFDDQHDPARVHTSCVVLPTVLATAEDIGAVSGRDFLLAFAIGAELHARLGLACYNSLGKGWHPTMVFGTLAAALAAGRLMGLDGKRLNDALGMAFHQASGSAQSMRDGVLSKRLGPGFAAHAAVLGTFLGADGLTGTRRTLEGNAGLFALYERGEVKLDALTDGLGHSWRVCEYSLKPYPCCRCNHTPIGLALQLRAQGVKPNEVESIEIRMGHVNWLTVGEPYDAERNEVVHAQFNASYSFARALVDNRVDLRSYQEPAITDPQVVSLTKVTRVTDDPAIEATAIEPARVKITLKSGRVIEAASDTMKGSPQAPMSQDEMLAKLRGCLEFGLGASDAHARRLADAVNTLERSGDAAQTLIGAFPMQGR